jgi:OmpA-OmpF porin, OOP family
MTPWPAALPLAARCATALVLGWLAGCGHVTDRVVLMPQTDGRASAVDVTRGDLRVRLDRPYAAAELSGGRLTALTLDAATVQQRYGALQAQLPPRPMTFVVRFDSNADRLTADSQPVLDQIRAGLVLLAAPEVVVTGHTDRVGTVEANDRLSLLRAEAVRDLLVAAGVPAAAITVAGRGEREPEVPTADEVAEARNRRVEIKIR